MITIYYRHRWDDKKKQHNTDWGEIILLKWMSLTVSIIVNVNFVNTRVLSAPKTINNSNFRIEPFQASF